MSLSLPLTIYFWSFLAFAVFYICRPFVDSFTPGIGSSRDFTQIRHWLAQLLRRGYNGGDLRVIHKNSNRFLNFRKYIRGKGDCGIEFYCAKPNWSDEERLEVISLAETQGLSYRLASRILDGADTDAVVVDFGQDTAAGYELAALAWGKTLGLSLKAPHRVEVEGWSDFFELVDGPNHPAPIGEATRIWGTEYAKNKMKKAGLPSLTMAFSLMALAPFMMVSAAGLPISILLSRRETPDWTVEFGTVIFGGDTFSLIFFVILVGSVLTVNSLQLRRLEFARPFDTWEKRILAVRQGFSYSLPFAVLLIWIGF